MAGIIEEQHPDRARLFMQWKQMRWPILVDSLNLLGTAAVPITLAIDEYGVIRKVNPKPEEIEEEFVNKTFEKPANLPVVEDIAPDLKSLKLATGQGTAEAWEAYANALVEWAKPERLGQAIESYQQALRLMPDAGDLHFRLGVAYRKRFDSVYRQPKDFQKAVDQWSAALETDPNQYIWRRRIQQYGPRLDKPYPFYDWVTTARAEIEARGGSPVPLSVEPTGAEIAHPEKTFATADGDIKEPDPKGQITRDSGYFVEIETAVVPGTRPQKVPARVHVLFLPKSATKTHWNNEAGNMVFWVNPPLGWKASRRLITLSNPAEATSNEPREVEFEVRGSDGRRAQPTILHGYALYYVCEDVNGVCMYRRQDISMTIAPH